jgi:hypothetical protein
MLLESLGFIRRSDSFVKNATASKAQDAAHSMTYPSQSQWENAGNEDQRISEKPAVRLC